MALHPTGSDELVYVQTEKLAVTIKGPASHPSFQGVEYPDRASRLNVYCSEQFDCQLREDDVASAVIHGTGNWTDEYLTAPIFYEQQRYEIIIEASDGHLSITHTAAGFPENGLSVNASTIYCFIIRIPFQRASCFRVF